MLVVSEIVPLAEVEDRYIRLIIKHTGGNKSKAAAILGIDRRTLYRRLAKIAEDDCNARQTGA